MSDTTDPNPLLVSDTPTATEADPPAPPAAPSLEEQLSAATLRLVLADALAQAAEEASDLFTPSTRAVVKAAIVAYRAARAIE